MLSIALGQDALYGFFVVDFIEHECMLFVLIRIASIASSRQF